VLEHEDNEMMRQFQVVPPVGVDPRPMGQVSFAGSRPNPFVGQTTFEFALPRAGDVKLTAFDAAGRLVRTLALGRQLEGTHRVAWDGRDDAGRIVASGVYLVRLEAGEVALVRKVLRLAP
jgi:flagellar hook assembly protein FlgD